jgi:hypothetical protein
MVTTCSVKAMPGHCCGLCSHCDLCVTYELHMWRMVAVLLECDVISHHMFPQIYIVLLLFYLFSLVKMTLEIGFYELKVVISSLCW